MALLNALRRDPMSFLRRVLRANAAFSTLTGLTMVLGGASLGAWLGRTASVAPDGVVLLVFAAVILWLTRRATVSLTAAWVVVALDGLWVLDTARQLLGGQFSTAGNWFYGVAALVVLELAVLQGMGAARAARSTKPSVAATEGATR